MLSPEGCDPPSFTHAPPTCCPSLPQPHPQPPNLAERVRVQQEVDGYYGGDGTEYLNLCLTTAARAAKKTLWELEPADLTHSICNPSIRIIEWADCAGLPLQQRKAEALRIERALREIHA